MNILRNFLLGSLLPFLVVFSPQAASPTPSSTSTETQTHSLNLDSLIHVKLDSFLLANAHEISEAKKLAIDSLYARGTVFGYGKLNLNSATASDLD
jgi:hypothetical protein